MRTCEICTKIPTILDEISRNGLIGECDHCNSMNVRYLDIEAVNQLALDFIIQVWMTTSHGIKHYNRFFYSTVFENTFLPALDNAVNRITENFVLFRSRLEGVKNENGNVIHPYPVSEMGSPPVSLSKNGRANARGITCLYTASNIQTAIAEIRPWKGAQVSVSRIITNKELLVIDLVTIKNTFEALYPNISLTNLLHHYLIILWGYDLSKPVSSPDTSEIEYAPTQAITEFIKFKGYDGLIYGSSLGEGNNIVIFDQSNVTIVDSQLFEVQDVRYEFVSKS